LIGLFLDDNPVDLFQPETRKSWKYEGLEMKEPIQPFFDFNPVLERSYAEK
jgi:hypothetical protein